MKQNYVTVTKLKMTMDFDFSTKYVTSTKLKKVDDKNVKPVNKYLNPIWMYSKRQIKGNDAFLCNSTVKHL